MVWLAVSRQYRRVTDRQTDRHILRQHTPRYACSIARRNGSEGAGVTCCGRLFQSTATERARLPTVDSRARRTINDNDEAERKAAS